MVIHTPIFDLKIMILLI